MKTVGAIIQGRMASTRLPGKTLKLVMGRPLLAYLIGRLRSCRGLDTVILATTLQDIDTPIAMEGKRQGIEVYRGSERDVLDRYYQAATHFGLDCIVRITADCPLLDPELCDRLVAHYLAQKVDYAYTGQNYAEGLDCEVFSYAALKRAWHMAEKVSEREHVTLFFRNRPELFTATVLENETDDSHYRITVDSPEDFEVVKSLLEHLYDDRALQPFGFNAMKEFLSNHPEIYQVNAHIVRNEGLWKSLQQEKNENQN